MNAFISDHVRARAIALIGLSMARSMAPSTVAADCGDHRENGLNQ